MDGLAKEYLVSFYSKNLMLHGDRPEALALNALSSHSDYKGAELNYTSPEDLGDFVSKNLTPHFVLRQDYLPGDFTIFLYRKAPVGSA